MMQVWIPSTLLLLLLLCSIPMTTTATTTTTAAAYSSSFVQLAHGRTTRPSSIPTHPFVKSPLLSKRHLHLWNQPLHTSLSLQSQNNNYNDNNDNNNNNNDNHETESILSRFTSPQIADPGLPLADALLAQIVAPSLQVFWLVSHAAPSPTWLQPLFPYSQLISTRGSLVAPTLIHGALLASCWLLASLAAKGYELEGFDVSLQKDVQDDVQHDGEVGGRYEEVLWRLLKAGAFAVGLLVLLTQLDLFWEFGGRFVQYGDGETSDIRIITATVEVINDCFFEGIVLGSWRLYRASLTAEENRL